MSQATPGPWKREGWLIVRDLKTRSKRYAIATCNTAAATSVDEQRANGDLIAAAPDLLAALRRAEQFIANGIEMGAIRMPGPDSGDSAVNTLPIIRAALAKVENQP